MVEIIELPKSAFEFIGRIVKVEKIESKRYPGSYRYHVEIEPTDKHWKNMHVWIPIPSTSSEKEVPRGTALAEFIKELKRIGIDKRTVRETFATLLNKTFLFKKMRLGRMENEVWVPVSLVKAKKRKKEIRWIRAPYRSRVTICY
jgi:hypothetical protein